MPIVIAGPSPRTRVRILEGIEEVPVRFQHLEHPFQLLIFQQRSLDQLGRDILRQKQLIRRKRLAVTLAQRHLHGLACHKHQRYLSGIRRNNHPPVISSDKPLTWLQHIARPGDMLFACLVDNPHFSCGSNDIHGFSPVLSAYWVSTENRGGPERAILSSRSGGRILQRNYPQKHS